MRRQKHCCGQYKIAIQYAKAFTQQKDYTTRGLSFRPRIRDRLKYTCRARHGGHATRRLKISLLSRRLSVRTESLEQAKFLPAPDTTTTGQKRGMIFTVCSYQLSGTCSFTKENLCPHSTNVICLSKCIQYSIVGRRHKEREILS